jgi:hypothetical protein
MIFSHIWQAYLRVILVRVAKTCHDTYGVDGKSREDGDERDGVI